MEQLKKLKDLDKLIKLDLSGNEVCNIEKYRDKVFDDFENLLCLDGKDRDNQSVESDDDEDYGNESGEFDKNGDEIAIPDDVLERLDPEIREKYKNGEISQAELLDFLNDDGDMPDLAGEEGEFEMEEGEAAVEEGDEGYGQEDEEDAE
jgi:hypothetical protein